MVIKMGTGHYITTEQLAERLGVKPAAIRNMRYRRIGLPYIAITAKKVMYREADVEAYLSARRIDPSAINAAPASPYSKPLKSAKKPAKQARPDPRQTDLEEAIAAANP